MTNGCPPTGDPRLRESPTGKPELRESPLDA
jgi:hypothetical protein